ncbi:MAG TPA: SusC/RagA family protein [Porphyromonadaceae bacterium]|nr:SusC/RagA family protein [Porphyromonadaceae bacterium]
MQENNNHAHFASKKSEKFLTVMKIWFLISLLCVFSISAENTYSQSKTVSAELKNITLREALQEIEKNSDYLFLVMDDTERILSTKVNASFNSQSIDEILNLLLKDTGLSYSIVNRQITISRKPLAEESKTEINTTNEVVQQTEKTITGRVVDEKGESIIGANIVEVGTTNGTITDVDGRFTFRVANDASIQISYIGYLTQTINTTGRTNFNITLVEDMQSLEEVVVVGYGTQRKANLTGAVSTVNVEETLGSRPIPDVGRGLQGTIPGLSIMVPSGEVGYDPIMKIRGQIGSIEGSSNPLILLDNVEIPSLQMVNPNDIESISVLKDAAASSIYGSKAAFGVILITTKKGAATEKTEITYSNNLVWQQPFKEIEIAGIDGLEYTLEAHKNMKASGPAGGFWRISDESFEKAKEWQEKYGSTIKYNDPVVYGRDWIYDGTDKYGYRIYDPVKTMIKNSAFSQNHNISLNGKRKETSYSLSVGYLGQEGMMKPAKDDNFNRFTGNLNLSTKITDFLTVRGGAMYSDATKKYPNSPYGFISDPWLYLYRWSRLFPTGVLENGEEIRDPYFDTKNAHTAVDRKKYSNLNLGTTLDLTENWDFNVDYAYSTQFNQETTSLPTFSAREPWYTPVRLYDDEGNQVYVDENGNPTDTGGMPAYRFPFVNYVTKDKSNYYKNSFTSDKHTVNVVTNYYLNLADQHMFKFMLGSNIVSYEWDNHWSKKTDLIDEDNPQFNFAVGTETVGGNTNWDSQVGYFGRVNYSYMDKYLLEGNLRYDATSKFPAHLRWRWYPSFSGGWVITNESFMQDLDPVLNFAKIRASWGLIGDQSVPNSLYLATMNISKNAWLSSNGEQFFQLGTPNPISAGISWQDIESLNLGLDLRLFKNKLGLVMEWFRRDTKNMIIPGEALPATYGASAPQGNYGNLRTKGWEISADFNHRFANGLRLSMNANLADAVTKITKGADWNTPYENRLLSNTYATGKTYGDIYGYVTDRLYQKEDFVYDSEGKIEQTTIIWEGTAKVTNKLAGNNPVYQTYFEDGNQILLISPGDVKFVDVNGDGYITPGKNTFGDPGDQVVIGNSTPRYEFGFRLGADFKGFDASIFFQGVGKRSIWGSGQLAIPGYHAKDGAMPQAIAEDFWKEDRTDAFYPRAWNLNGANEGFVMRKQSRYMLNMAYLKLKNITLGYTLPQNVLQSLYLSNARIYLSLENFVTFDKLRGLPIDPEAIPGFSPLRPEGNYNLGRTGTGNPAFKSASVGVQFNL